MNFEKSLPDGSCGNFRQVPEDLRPGSLMPKWVENKNIGERVYVDSMEINTQEATDRIS